MKKNQQGNRLELSVSLSLSPEKRKAIEMYSDGFLSELQEEVQKAAEKILSQTYSRKVPKVIRDYVERCEKLEEKLEQND
ncbi:MAG: hypothetical protein ACLSAP_11725 [Oscillospiraceae bacterium]